MKHHNPSKSVGPKNKKGFKSAIITVFFLTFALGLCLIAFWPKEYHGKAYITISPQENPVVLSQLSPVQFGTRTFIGKQVSSIRGKMFLTKFASQYKLNQRWKLTPSKTYGRLKRNTKVQALSNSRFVISFASKDPEEAVEIANLIGKAFLADWRAINGDLFNELNNSLKSDQLRFRKNAEEKLAAFQAMSKATNVKKADLQFAKNELLDLKAKDSTIVEQMKALRLERTIIASAARIDNNPEDHTLVKSVDWKSGFGFSLLLSLFTSCIVGGFLYIRATKAEPIPELSGSISDRREITLVPSNREQYAATKPFESLRQKILELTPNPEGLTISMVPCLADEDAAGVSSQLAKAFSDSAYPTLLIEGNLRNPRLHTFFNASAQPGLVELLNGEMTLEQTVVKTQEDNLWLLPGGIIDGVNPSDILNQQTRKALIEEIRSRFDVVIFSNAPILSGIDSLIVIGDSDLSYVCTAHDLANSELLTKTRNAIHETGGNFGGIVLTRLDAKEFEKVSSRIDKALA